MRKPKSIQLILLLTLLGIMISCKTNYGFKTYVFDSGLKFEKYNGIVKPHPQTTTKKSIVIVSDSTLNYTVLLGDFGASTTIKYELKNEILKIDTVDIYNRKSFQGYTNEIFGYEFKYSNDSLIDKMNGEKYYVNKPKEKTDHFYIVYKNKVHRIKNQRSADRILRKIEPIDTSRLKILNKNTAKSKYGINEKYKTFEYK